MCGIGLLRLFQSTNFPASITKSKFIKSLSRRGPDATSEFELTNYFWMVGNVLHIQGKEGITQQPLVDELGNLLLWNGEVFGETTISTVGESKGSSDTLLISGLFRKSLEAISNIQTSQYVASIVATTLTKIQGPYAFIYFHAKTSTLLFGRDPFGRRSLLTLKSSDDGISKYKLLGLASVIPIDLNSEIGIWEEVGVEGVYAIRLDSNVSVVEDELIQLAYWPENVVRLGRSKSVLLDTSTVDNSMDTIVTKFLEVLKSAVRKRLERLHINNKDLNLHPSGSSSPVILNFPSHSSTISPIQRCRVGVLFSGGIDSVLLAALLHLCLLEEEEKKDKEEVGKIREPIDLVNVTFESESSSSHPSYKKQNSKHKIDLDDDIMTTTTSTTSPDRLAAIAALGELQSLYPDRNWRLIHVDVKDIEREKYQPHILQLISPSDTSMDLNIGTAFWFAARASGYLRQYTAETISSVYQANCQGRPLLRRGGQDAAKSVGLSDYQPQQQSQSQSRVVNKVDRKKNQDANVINSVINSDNSTSSSMATNTNTTNNTYSNTLFCANTNCKKVSKQQCPFSLCRKCCLRHVALTSTSTTSDIDNDTSSTSTTFSAITNTSNTDSTSNSVYCTLPNYNENHVLVSLCKVHKQKYKSNYQTREDKTKDSLNSTFITTTNNNGHNITLKESNIQQDLEVVEEEKEECESESRLHIPLSNFILNEMNSSDKHTISNNSSLEVTSPLLLLSDDKEYCYQSTAKFENKEILLPIDSSYHVATPYDTTITNISTTTTSSNSVSSTDSHRIPYDSTAKVFLVGLGADEQLGGYSRHRSCYQRGGEVALRNELAVDCARLWKRNLGRDDRCISDNGKEAWFPYLDEDVVTFIQSLPLHAIVDLSLPPGEGDKLVLRQAARLLGLTDTTTLVKRAIQFGSRIAQITNAQNFGSNRKGQGKTKISLLSSTATNLDCSSL